MTRNGEQAPKGLRSRDWHYSYRTSAAPAGGRPVDILHDFYIPALSLSVRYDRVAGYFSSTSLAAASQGFSAFVGEQGRMRLIVGADLAPADVEAILEGDQRRYAEELERQMGEPESWPADVRRGVELLCWMVAHGYLEVRVAFRVHGESHEPIPYYSVEDGYVHEKWAVFGDEPGHRLLASGSLNESRRALVRNAENLDVHCDWWGERERRRVDDAERDFENLWHDRHAHFRVMTLPEAVRRRLLRLADSVEHPTEVDGTSAAPRRVDPPSALERLKFALVCDGPKLPGGRFVGMETAPVEPWPHQAVVARRLVETWPYSYLLCDEVGLGKTIEAGLAIRSLYLSGLVRRVLVAPPASLKEQWQREMASKFLLPFALTETSPALKHTYIHPGEETVSGQFLYGPSLNIVSRNMLERRDRRRDVERAEPFEVVLVDEAHAARRRNPTEEGARQHPEYGNLYETLRDQVRKKARALWLATATPMQLERIEAWDLLRLSDRVGPFQFDPSLTLQYYDLLGRLVRDEEPHEQEWDLLRRAVRFVKRHDPILWEFICDTVMDGRVRGPSRRWLEDGLPPRGRDRRHMRRLIFAAAPLSRVMLRHTRHLLEIYRKRGKLEQNLARREIQPVPRINFTRQEADAYEALNSYCEELGRQIRRCAERATRQNLGFYKSFLRLRFASSFRAISETVRRRRERVGQTLEMLPETGEPDGAELEETVMEPEEEAPEVEHAGLKGRSEEDLRWELKRLDELADTLRRLEGPSRKMRHLLTELDQRRQPGSRRIRQTVVFTRFLDTLDEIVQRLRDADGQMRIGTYSGRGGQYVDAQTGRLLAADREEVKGSFLRGRVDVLVCTDAAAEGLNLQTADMVINYDLPWNPMKVEQRIGRLDRIGQEHEQVVVLNLCYLNSTEEIVYGRLLRRLRDAGRVVGAQQVSMLPVTPEEFRKLADGDLGEKELEELTLRRAEEQRERTRSMEIPAAQRYEMYMRLERERGEARPPVDLGAIWSVLKDSAYLEDLGCLVREVDGGAYLEVRGVAGVPEKTRLTTSRELYEEGLPTRNGRLHFASYGDEYFDALLAHVEQFDLPGCARRLTSRPKELEAEVVGYAVTCRGRDGREQVRLVTKWDDLRGLKLAEEADMPEHEAEKMRRKLANLAREEFESASTAHRVERINVKAGHGQILLAHLVARHLISFRGRTASDGERFADVLAHLEALLEGEREISIPSLPKDALDGLEQELLFEPKIPALGSEASILASSPLLRCAVDAACREADALKFRRSELMTESVINRLDSMIEEEIKRLNGL